MINAPTRPHCYVAIMRSVRHARVSRRVQEGAAEQMRRLGDGVIACMLLGLNAPLMVLVAPTMTTTLRRSRAGSSADRREQIRRRTHTTCHEFSSRTNRHLRTSRHHEISDELARSHTEPGKDYVHPVFHLPNIARVRIRGKA